jgi:hypothetical protein
LRREGFRNGAIVHHSMGCAAPPNRDRRTRKTRKETPGEAAPTGRSMETGGPGRPAKAVAMGIVANRRLKIKSVARGERISNHTGCQAHRDADAPCSLELREALELKSARRGEIRPIESPIPVVVSRKASNNPRGLTLGAPKEIVKGLTVAT